MITVFSSLPIFLLIHCGYLFDYFLSGFRIVGQDGFLKTKDFCEVKMFKKYKITSTKIAHLRCP